MTKLLIVPDSFKDCLNSFDVANALKAGIQNEDYLLEVLPLADGGEGSLAVLETLGDFKRFSCYVSNPLGIKIQASYLIDQINNTAFIEMAQASGIERLVSSDRNPMNTSTYGTGELILDALEKKIENIFLFVGSSSTNDGGLGMLTALGFSCFAGDRLLECPTGKDLEIITRINSPKSLKLKLNVICDVDNPFTGSKGASKIYAAQKGASETEIEILEKGMMHLHELTLRQTGIELNNIPGSGAAGGIAGGAVAFLHANLIKGFDFMNKAFFIEDKVKNADVVITGEGSLDQQTINGKLIKGISALCLKFNKPLFVVCGQDKMNDETKRQLGIKYVWSIAEITNYVPFTAKSTTTVLSSLGKEIVKKCQEMI